MNKKILLFLPLAAMMLSGCVMYNGKPPVNKEDQSTEPDDETNPGGDVTPSGGGDNTPVTPVVPTGEVTTYLVLGEQGRYRGNKGTDVDSLFLENTITFKANVGTNLPGSDEISSTAGSNFICWQAYEGDGSTKQYNSVPAIDGKILYAKFSGGNGSGGGGGGSTPTPDDGMPKSGFGFYFSDSSYVVGTLLDDKDAQGRTQYKITNYEFHAGDQFTLYDFQNKAGWVENLDPWSFGGTSDSSTYWQKYVTKSSSMYTAQVDFSADVYLKMAFEDNLIYFQRTDTNPPIDGGDVVPASGFGINFLNGDKVNAVKQSEQDAQGREQYLISDQVFTAGQQFQLWDFTNSAGWVVDIDGYSFGGSGDDTWKSYLSKGTSYYTVQVDMTVDIYLKFKYGDDQVYIGLKSDPIPEDTSNKITVYFAGVKDWADMNEVHIGLTEDDLATASLTSGDDANKGQYKRSITSTATSTSLHMYFTNTSNQYRHPVNDGDHNEGEYDTMSSTIALGSISSLQPGHEYVITWTAWAHNYEDWSHAWYTYTFAQIS